MSSRHSTNSVVDVLFQKAIFMQDGRVMGLA